MDNEDAYICCYRGIKLMTYELHNEVMDEDNVICFLKNHVDFRDSTCFCATKIHHGGFSFALR